jgi:hypothetical protein
MPKSKRRGEGGRSERDARDGRSEWGEQERAKELLIGRRCLVAKGEQRKKSMYKLAIMSASINSLCSTFVLQ